ncbi:uncharacterized protein LOC110691225 [Chenopodium quinoa]|uniref:Uncharacterized protein n=1 Tax=Chenopodium quinoa TaxID=63459 RepID=A0A803MU19_CHEQI|nr:uncharacterized protein LOC110691225 [Chenopodium quinoa]
MEELKLSQKKRARVDSDPPEFDAKRVREDLLRILDDSDHVPERDSVSQTHDLDSVIRSFEEEITGSGSRSSPVNIVDLTSDSGEYPSEIGQFCENDVGLLKESESETRVGDGIGVSSEVSGVGEFWDFPSYDSFGLTIGYEQDHNDYVALDGIFDHSDLNFGSDFLRRPDTLPAV